MRLGESVIDACRHCVRDAIRGLRAAPATSACAILFLTLGIAAATVTFSVVDSVVLRPPPYPHGERLIAIGWQTPRGAGAIAPHEYLALGRRVEALENLAAVQRGTESLSFGNETETVRSAHVTASLFAALGVGPILGSTFDQHYESEGRPPVAVIGHSLWERRFGGDSAVIGRTVRLQGAPFEIVGVMPKGFTYPVTPGMSQPVEVWTPYIVPADERTLTIGRTSYLHVVGRLRDGASLEQARAQVESVIASFATAYPQLYLDGVPTVASLHDSLVAGVRGWMLLVLWAVVLVLVLACVNVANLLLIRSVRRTRELAVRASLGATRARLVLTLVLESLMLSATATAFAILIASWGIGIAAAALPEGVARVSPIALNVRVLATAVAASVLAGMLCGLLPAWQSSRADLVVLLKDAAMTMTPGRRRWRNAFLVTEVAFVVVLLVSTALFVTSFIQVTRADLGFDRSNLIAVPPLMGFRGDPLELTQRVRSVPGVVDVATVMGSSPPLIAAAGYGGGYGTTILAAADDTGAERTVHAEMYRVSENYFEVARVRLVRGRAFTHGESTLAVILDDLAARRLFGDRDPVGARLRSRGTREYLVVGVVANVRTRGAEAEPVPHVYMPTMQAAMPSHLLVRTAGSPAAELPAVKAALEDLRPAGGSRVEAFVLEDAFRRLTADRRFSAGLMGVFGFLAVFIGITGIHAVMASGVAQRTQEIGVRVALGATPGQIATAVLTEAALYVCAGLAIGIPAALTICRTFAALLFGVVSSNALVYVGVAGMILAIALIAATIPALRAARVDPLVALRQY